MARKIADNTNMDIRAREKRFADAFYVSQAWRKCAAGYKASVGGLCERCLRRGLITPAEEVHHKIRLTQENINRPEVALNWRNLEALCKECHLQTHRKPKRWNVDEDGNVTPRDPP
jgi:5-methylcytosine-specific restriction endonuclease McrA